VAVTVTVALWTGAEAWLLGATMYLPETWLTPAQRTKGRIPGTVKFQPKWQLALTHDWRGRRLASEVWLLCERDLGATRRTKYYLVDLPPTSALKSLAAFRRSISESVGRRAGARSARTAAPGILRQAPGTATARSQSRA
jgi:hypothetical protein